MNSPPGIYTVLGFPEGDEVGVRGGRGVLVGLGVLVGAPTAVGVLVEDNSTRNAVVGVLAASGDGCEGGGVVVAASFGPQATSRPATRRKRARPRHIDVRVQEVAFIGQVLLSDPVNPGK